MADIKVLKDKLGNILNPHIPRYENLGKFSTEEVKTGMKWIDSKDIYCIIIKSHLNGRHSGSGNATSVQLKHNISNIDNCLYALATISNESIPGMSYILPMIPSTTGLTAISQFTREFVEVRIWNDSWDRDIMFTLFYTKN